MDATQPSDGQDLPASSEKYVRQCTHCGRADLREWFPDPDQPPPGPWDCQICEESEARVRDLRQMLTGRLLPLDSSNAPVAAVRGNSSEGGTA